MPALLLALAGCGDSDPGYDATVQGTVTIDDELAQGGTVMFHPVKVGPPAVGSIAKDGSYSLRIGQGDPGDPDYSGIPSGEYVATCSITGPSEKNERVGEGGPPSAGPRLMADRYTDKKTSDLEFTVKEGANIIVLKLDGPWANPPVEETSDDEAGAEGASTGQDEVVGADEPAAAESPPAASDQKTEQGDSAAANADAPESPSDPPAPAEGTAPVNEQQPPAEGKPQ